MSKSLGRGNNLLAQRLCGGEGGGEEIARWVHKLRNTRLKERGHRRKVVYEKREHFLRSGNHDHTVIEAQVRGCVVAKEGTTTLITPWRGGYVISRGIFGSAGGFLGEGTRLKTQYSVVGWDRRRPWRGGTRTEAIKRKRTVFKRKARRRRLKAGKGADHDVDELGDGQVGRERKGKGN